MTPEGKSKRTNRSRETSRSKTAKRLLSTGLILFTGYAFGLGGCGGAREGFDPNIPIQADADVPENLARQIRACAAEHRTHLGSVNHSIAFDVTFASDGDVGEMTLLGSTLRDEGLEACMASALRSLSEDDLPLYGSNKGFRGTVAPEARALLGQEEIILLACLENPPCLLTLTLLVGITSITMLLYVHNTKTLPSPAPAPQAAPPEPEAPKPEPKPMGKPTKTVDPPPPPPPLPPRETCEEKEPHLIRCDDRKLRAYEFNNENATFNRIVKQFGKGLTKQKSGDDAIRGPCKKRGGFHTKVKRGKDYIASIVGCNCCDDSSGKAVKKTKTQIQYH